MSQAIWTSINPTTTSGLMLASLLDDFKDALMTGFAGTSRPAQLQAGGVWVDTTNQTAPNYYWSFKMYNGTDDTEIFRISILNGFGGTLTADADFKIQHIAADTSGAILNLVKQRISNNGQVLSGDVVGELRFTGRTNASGDPVVAYMRFTATDDMDVSNSGGTFSIATTKDATAAINEHMRFIAGQFETVVPQKINSLKLVSQDVATAATIVKLNADKVLVEMTGATATDIQGIDSDGDTWLITIHNRSTANVTLKHQNATAAIADRLSLPNASDQVIAPQSTAQLFYCTTTSRWKLKSATNRKLSRTIEKLNGAWQQWTAPTNATRIRLVAYNPNNWRMNATFFQDPFGNLFAWGQNANGRLGVGDVTNRSSPVAVLGGIKWARNIVGESFGHFQETGAAYGLGADGAAYGWGINTSGGLGVGDVTPRSSPVAVLGGLKFAGLIPMGLTCFGLTQGGDLYAWGNNNKGMLGVGDNTNRSSPILVLGNLKVSRMGYSMSGSSGSGMFAITRDGAAYAWGQNTAGQLGVGDVVARSSPVAVLGGLTWKKIIAGNPNSSSTGSSWGLTTGGQIYAWGTNSVGQLGVGDTTDRSSPVAVLGGLTFQDVVCNASGTFALGLTTTGALYAWGANLDGNLGLGDVVARSSPVAVLGGLTFQSVQTMQQCVHAITTTGALYGWGKGTGQFGTIGDNGGVPRSSPVAVVSVGSNIWEFVVDYLSFNNTGNIGVQPDGTMYAWGNNAFGEAGVGTTSQTNSPTALATQHQVGPNTPVLDLEIPVTGGATYNVIMSQGTSYFGNTLLGNNIDKITIEYEI